MSNQVILLHGFGTNHQVFAYFVPLLQPFNAQAVDLMGYDGKASEFILSQAVDILSKKIDNAVHLLGWSLGGVVALEMAARKPEKVKTLTLISSFAKYAKTDDYAAGVDIQGFQKYAQNFADDFSGSLNNFFRLNAMANPHKLPQFERIADKIMALGQPEKSVLISSHKAVMESDLREKLPQIQIPTLIITGEKDRITPPAMGDYLQQNLINSHRLHFANATHTPFIDNAEECANALKEFWSRYA